MDTIPKKTREVFLAAINLPAQEREAYLRETCESRPELFARVSALLQAQAEIGSFYETPFVTVDQPFAESAGMFVGPYKLIERIGEGGMGTVWMAQQTEPVKRMVALKLIKAGLDSRQVVARFEAERQALALMDHAHISRVLDAGTTGSGRPYFVMDLVKGVPITKYCDQHHLTPHQRLELFIPVCQAVQHAHQKGIIHRDLKPSNVLVALYDGQPVPKVIDFGVAKATGQALTDKTLVTGFGNIVGTLEYMSPEQAELNQLDIDTRSDIYSLGVLLYELLVGSPPFSRKDLEQAGMLEMLRVIREEEPSKPSTKLSSSAALPALSASRGTEPAKLTKLVRGELDWIVMKALEKDRNRRYETAKDFAADVQRYLVDEPVQACPPSSLYRFRKFVRRQKTGLVIGGLIMLCVITLGSSIGWIVRDRDAQRAAIARQHELRQAKRIGELQLLLDRAELYQEQGQRAETLAAYERATELADELHVSPVFLERLAALKQRVDDAQKDAEFVVQFDNVRLLHQSELDVARSAFVMESSHPKIREALEGYGFEIGITPVTAAVVRIKQRPKVIQEQLLAAFGEWLWLAPKEETPSRQWMEAVRDGVDGDPERVKMRRAARAGDWQTLEEYAHGMDVQRHAPSFVVAMARSLPRQPERLELLRRFQRAHPGDFWANHELAQALREAGKPAEAVRYHTAALALRPNNPGVYLNCSLDLKDLRELDEAEAGLRKAISLAPEYAAAHSGLGSVLYAKQDWNGALAAFRQAITLDPKLVRAYSNLGGTLCAMRQFDDALDAIRQAIALDPNNAEAHNNLGVVLSRQGHVEEAITSYRRASKLNPKYADAYFNLGVTLNDQGKVEEAVAAFREAIQANPSGADAFINLGVALSSQGKLDEAIASYQQAIKLQPERAAAYTNLGQVCKAQQKLPEAVFAFRKAIELNPNDPTPHNGLGSALTDQGQRVEALACFQRAISLDPTNAFAHSNLCSALRFQGKLDEAIEAGRTATRLNPKSAIAYLNLGGALGEHNKPDEAIEALRTAVKLNPQSALGYFSLSSALYHQQRFPEFVDAFRAAIKLDPRLTRGSNNMLSPLLHEAACIAVTTAGGKGVGADKLDSAAKAQLRGQALDWFRSDLVERGKLLDFHRAQLVEHGNLLQRWLVDPSLSSVRDAQSLAELPVDEREAWLKLWSDVRDYKDRTETK